MEDHCDGAVVSTGRQPRCGALPGHGGDVGLSLDGAGLAAAATAAEKSLEKLSCANPEVAESAKVILNAD